MAIWELTHTMSLQGQLCQNKYNFATLEAGASAITAQALCLGFADGWFPVINDVLTQSTVGQSVYARNLYDPTDFFEDTANVANGAVSSDALPSFVAWSFRSNRGRTDMRRGYKRFPGVPETFVSAGVATAGALVELGQIAALMDDPLVLFDEGSPVSLLLAILGREKYLPNPTEEPDNWQYRYFETEAAQREKMFFPTDWDYMGLTTQRTRKIGQGI